MPIPHESPVRACTSFVCFAYLLGFFPRDSILGQQDDAVALSLDWTLNSFVLLFYAIAIVVQLYHGANMMHEMRRKPEPTRFLTHEILNLPHHISLV